LRWGDVLQRLVPNRPVFTIIDADFDRLEPGMADSPPYVARCDHHDAETMFYSCGYADLQQERLHLNSYSSSVSNAIRDLIHEAAWAQYSNLQRGDTFCFGDVCFSAACRFLEGKAASSLEALYECLRWSGPADRSVAEVQELRVHADEAKRKFSMRGRSQDGFDWDVVIGHHVQQAFAAMVRFLPASSVETGCEQSEATEYAERNVRYGLQLLIRTDVEKEPACNGRLRALRRTELCKQLALWETRKDCRLLRCRLVNSSLPSSQDCRRCRALGR
jgi:hypothetical protein